MQRLAFIVFAILVFITGCLGTPSNEGEEAIGLGDVDPFSMNVGMGIGMNDNQMNQIMTEIGLTEQDVQYFKDQIKEIQTTFRSKIDAPDHGKWKALFIQDTFEVDSIKQELAGKHQSIRELLPSLLPNIQNIFSHLTKDQRQQLFNHFEDHKANMHEKHAEHRAKGDKMIERLIENLNLSDSQKDSVMKLREEMETSFEKHFTEEHQQHLDQIKKLVAGDQITEESILALWDTMEPKISEHINQTISYAQRLHGILTKDQRQKLVDLMESHHKKMMGKFKGQGGNHFFMH